MKRFGAKVQVFLLSVSSLHLATSPPNEKIIEILTLIIEILTLITEIILLIIEILTFDIEILT